MEDHRAAEAGCPVTQGGGGEGIHYYQCILVHDMNLVAGEGRRAHGCRRTTATRGEGGRMFRSTGGGGGKYVVMPV